jgi:8-oxo-dGTP diphosphatase
MRARPLVAVHIFLIREGRVLMLRRYGTGYEDGNYSVPAGHVEAGEEVFDAAIREAAEEVGVTLLRRQLTVVGVMQRRSDDERIDFFLSAERWGGEPANLEPSKCDELRWCDPADLPENTVEYVRQALRNSRGGPWFDSMGWPAVNGDAGGRSGASG